MSRLTSDKPLKLHELVHEAAQASSHPEAEVVIDFRTLPTFTCPCCGEEQTVEVIYHGIATKVETDDRDRFKAIHIVCKED